MEFYSTSARILDVLLSSPTSAPPPPLRSLITTTLSKSHSAKSSPARSYALLAETLKYLPTLTKLLDSVDLLSREAKVLGRKASPSPRALVLVLLHDLLFAKKGIALPKEHKIRMAVERYSVRFKANLQREKIRAGVTSDEALQVSIQKYLGDEGRRTGKGKGKALSQDGLDDSNDYDDSLEGQIRWLRVNEFKWSTEDAVRWLEGQGWRQIDSLALVASSESRCFRIDEHIPNLLAFPVLALSLPKFAPYKDSRLIAQDKASCMPAYLLLQDTSTSSLPTPDEGITVLDATSAPGNKTSYAAASLNLLGQPGKVYAFERDYQRYDTLRKMMKKAGCTNVETINADFLTVDPEAEPYRSATHILVDPSCSGSGIHDDPDIAPEEVAARLHPLSAFQQHILNHALRFPHAQRVVYSTCSVHAEENEQVILSVLGRKEHKHTWCVQRREKTLPRWELRGADEKGKWPDRKEELQGMIRCERRLGTHGFFVTVLERTRASDQRAHASAASATVQSSNVLPASTSPSIDQASGRKTRSRSTWLLEKPEFSLLRLAMLNRKRRVRQETLEAAERYRARGRV